MKENEMDMQTVLPSPSLEGEGFDYKALLAKAQRAMASGKEVRVSPRSIRPLPNQPRKLFNHEGLLRLGHSMQLVGQIQPGIIRAVKAEVPIEYELLDGERRWRSAQMVELDYRATLIELDDDAVPWLIAAVANFNREGHTPTELADSIDHMVKLKIPMEEIAGLIGISLHWAYQMYGLKKLQPDVWDMLDPTLPRDRQLPVTAAIQISKVDPSLQLALAEQVLSRKITVRNVREAAVAASQKAGLHIRRRALEPRKLWESVRGNMQQALRASQNLERLLKEANIKAAIHGRVQIDVWTLLNGLEETRQNLEKCETKIKSIRPD